MTRAMITKLVNFSLIAPTTFQNLVFPSHIKYRTRVYT